jgi:hypothetical protein
MKLALTLIMATGIAVSAWGQGTQSGGQGPAAGRGRGTAWQQEGAAGAGAQRGAADCPCKGNGQCDGTGPKRDGSGQQCGRQGRCGRR